MISSAVEATPATSDTVCPQCSGAGFFKKAVPVTDADFGRLFPCSCRREAQARRAADDLLAISNLGAFLDKRFENFNSTMPGVQRAFIRAKNFAERPAGWLVLMGNYGCGKTHLAASVANRLIENHYRVLFAVVPDLLDHLRSAFGPTSEVEYDRRFEDVRDAQILILDDLGTEHTTGWAREKLYQIINHRYNHAMPTVVTSNCEPRQIDPRIFSRLSDRALSEEITVIDASDFRQLTPQQRYGQVNARRRA